MSEDDTTTNEASGLRKQLEEAIAENKELKAYRRQNELGSVLNEFGLDPNKGPGKFATGAYDGEVAADAFRDWLQSEGFEPNGTTSEQGKTEEQPAGLAQRQEQQKNLQQLRDASESGTDQKVSSTDLMQLAKTDPAKARLLLNTPGAVELKHSSA